MRGSRMMLTATLLLAAAAPVQAGRRTPAEVSVDANARVASGALGSARASGDSQELIGCSTTMYPPTDPNSSDYPFRVYNCFARTSTGASAGCAVFSNYDFDIFPVLAEDSFIRFTWDQNGTCTSIRVENYSYYAPVQP